MTGFYEKGICIKVKKLNILLKKKNELIYI
jgi:hypothetical protein